MKNILVLIFLLFSVIDSFSQDKLNSCFLKRKINNYNRTFSLGFHAHEKINFRVYYWGYREQYHSDFFDSIVYSFTDNVYLPKRFKNKFAFGIVEGKDSCFSIIIGPTFKGKSNSMIPNMGYKLVLQYQIINNHIEFKEAYNAYLQ